MPVIPQFDPQGSPSEVSSVIAQAGNAAMSWRQGAQSLMTQAGENRRRDEAAQMAKMEWDIKKPVMMAQAEAEMSMAGAELAASKTIAQALAKKAILFPDLVAQWEGTGDIEDPKERLVARRQVMGALSPFASIKRFAPIVQGYKEQMAQDSIDDRIAETLMSKGEITGALNDAKAAKTQADNETKLVLKQKDAEIAQMKAEHAAALREAQLAAREREVEAKTKSNEKIAEGRAVAAGSRPKEAAARKYNETEIVSRVRPSTEELPKFMRALDILESPEVRTGTAAGLETAARRFGEIFGFDVGKAASLEELQSTLGSSFLNYVGQMKGAISDKETQALISMSPGVGKTAAGNIALVNNIVRALNRNIAMGQVVLEGRDAGETEAEIQSTVLRNMIDTPMESFAPARGTAAPIQIKSIKQVSP